ncbi:nickel ABC transporter ATP-binding protein NikE [Microbacterium azadirachtae]|uniref:Glutathione import ATP-binding protein GsiA n=1 Tax=Microbacterium azadirachtae TaxID=582680 RepID=A0A0F0LI18_9MICO|nr:ABC transporter ATP-binding protein [Microbacterium azadirachtae]KJL32309.1 Glutathione import ATP-binding protein GsiA [Microbacterium azadirachtae]
MTVPVLEIADLDIFAPGADGPRQLVFGSSLSVQRGQAIGLVGESGSGKTLTVRAVAGLLPEGFGTSGTIRIDGQDLSTMTPRALRDLRAHRLGMVFQTPRAHLNSLRTIGDFMTEALVHVAGVKPSTARARAIELLDEVGINDPGRRLHQHPGELSGGLLQRVMIAATLAMDPDILLADEITTALDVTTQEEVMAVIADLRTHRELSLLFITHDLALAGAVCDRVNVMQHGRIVETLNAATMRQDATDDYTQLLMSAALDEVPPIAANAAAEQPVISIEDLRKTYQVRAASGAKETLVAVDDVSLQLAPGGSLGIVGESGSGKSTTARVLLGLERADSGRITVDGQDWSVPARRGKERRARAKIAQMVFQDPYQSLDRRQTIRQCLTESVRVHRPKVAKEAVAARVTELMAQVRLDEALLDTRPRALSGGQRQRVAIARALAADPVLLVLDEAVSALDVTTQVEILTLLDRIRRMTGVALLMITHDLTVIRRLCDHVVVMRQGVIEERGTAAEILDNPQAEYTKLLLDSIPREGWSPRRRRLGRTKSMPTVTRSTIIPR